MASLYGRTDSSGFENLIVYFLVMLFLRITSQISADIIMKSGFSAIISDKKVVVAIVRPALDTNRT